MTDYFPPCSAEDGEGAECGYCSRLICCYDHWQKNHMPTFHPGEQ